MAHNIYDSTFYAHRTPAWHRLGLVDETHHSAAELGDMLGLPEVYEQPIAVKYAGVYMPVHAWKAIVGVSPGRRAEVYAVVGSEYEIVTHTDFARLFDRATGSRVETMGLLGKGETLFLTAPMSTIDVKGDEVHNFLLMLNPLNGRWAVRSKVTSVRVVCMNTLMVSLGEATEHELRLTHNRRGMARMIEDWVAQLWRETTGMTEMLKEAYGALANLSLVPDQVSEALEVVYPTPDDPEPHADANIAARIENERLLAQAHQSAVLELFEGSKTRTPATIGTAWGLYNACIEFEDFGKARASKRSVVFGAGAARKERMFAHLHALTRT
jgi:phage/plasmid-like protein (TIGR03299 family)